MWPRARLRDSCVLTINPTENHRHSLAMDGRPDGRPPSERRPHGADGGKKEEEEEEEDGLQPGMRRGRSVLVLCFSVPCVPGR